MVLLDVACAESDESVAFNEDDNVVDEEPAAAFAHQEQSLADADQDLAVPDRARRRQGQTDVEVVSGSVFEVNRELAALGVEFEASEEVGREDVVFEAGVVAMVEGQRVAAVRSVEIELASSEEVSGNFTALLATEQHQHVDPVPFSLEDALVGLGRERELQIELSEPLHGGVVALILGEVGYLEMESRVDEVEKAVLVVVLLVDESETRDVGLVGESELACPHDRLSAVEVPPSNRPG